MFLSRKSTLQFTFRDFKPVHFCSQFLFSDFIIELGILRFVFVIEYFRFSDFQAKVHIDFSDFESLKYYRYFEFVILGFLS